MSSLSVPPGGGGGPTLPSLPPLSSLSLSPSSLPTTTRTAKQSGVFCTQKSQAIHCNVSNRFLFTMLTMTNYSPAMQHNLQCVFANIFPCFAYFYHLTCLGALAGSLSLHSLVVITGKILTEISTISVGPTGQNYPSQYFPSVSPVSRR